FIINKLAPTDFFINGFPCDALILDVIRPIKSTYYSTLFNNTSIINAHFNKRDVLKSNLSNLVNYKYGLKMYRTFLSLPWPQFTGIYNQHIPIPYLKETFDIVWNKEKEMLTQTSLHKFRNSTNVNHFIFRYWQ